MITAFTNQVSGQPGAAQDRRVIGGVDAQADTHDAAALDERGRLLGTRTFPTDSAGQRTLLAWLEQCGQLALVGVESTGSYAASLVRFLRTHGVEVVEVNRPHAHARRRRGKSDRIDAEMAARQALAGDATAVPKLTTGIVESIRQLRVARDSALKARSAALCQLTDLIVSAPDPLRDQLAKPKTTRAKAALCSRLRPRASRLAEPAEAAKFALRSVAWRIAQLDDEINALDQQLAPLVATAAPRTTQLLGISTGHAGQLLVTAAQNIERLANDGAFAALCGASPIPISSGRRDRHRLKPGGDHDANRTLHMIAVVRLRYCQRTRTYAQRRITEGKPSPRSSAASSATSPARPSRPSAPTSPTSRRSAPHARPSPPRSLAAPAPSDARAAALDIYRNVRGRRSSHRAAVRAGGNAGDERGVRAGAARGVVGALPAARWAC